MLYLFFFGSSITVFYLLYKYLFIYQHYNGIHYPKYRMFDKYVRKYNKALIKLGLLNLNKKNAYDLLNNVHDIFNKYNTFFWLSEGTALGFFRNNDFIDYDDDVDIGLFIDSKDNFIQYILPELVNKGFIITRIDVDRDSSTNKHGKQAFISMNYLNISLDIDIVGLGYRTVATGNNIDSIYILPYLQKFKKIIIGKNIFYIPLEPYYVFLYGRNYMTPIKNKKPTGF